MIVDTNTFGNFQQVDNPRVIVIPVPYEYSNAFNKGTKKGPQAILNASANLEAFDDELWTEISNLGINTTELLHCEFVKNNSKEPFKEVEFAVRNAVIKGAMPLILGGECSISFGALKAIYDLYQDVSVLYFSAHANLKESYKENKFNCKCVLRRVIESFPEYKLLLVGTRNLSYKEASWLEETNPKLEIFFARDKNHWSVADLLSSLTKNVYISFDFNVFDPGIMPSVTSPEPGGLSYEQVLDILKNVCTFKEVVGIDFVGLSPNESLRTPDYLTAKLIYKTIGYSFARELGAFEEEKNETLVATE